MEDFVAAAKRFHRKMIPPRPNRVVDCPPAPTETADPDLIPVGDASAPFTKSDKEQASERLKEETKGQTLGEWYEKEKKKPAPADDEWSEEAREKAAEARKSGSSKSEGEPKKKSTWNKKEEAKALEEARKTGEKPSIAVMYKRMQHDPEYAAKMEEKFKRQK